MKKLIALAFASALISTPTMASESPAKLKLCIGCHGADGNSIVPTYPKLAGQHAKYLEKQLKDFRGGFRKSPVMQSFAKNLTDQDIKELATFFSQQKAK